MGFEFKPAAPAPAVSGNYAKLPQFVGKLLVVVPYEDNVPSKFKNEDGTPQFQTRATVVPAQSGNWTNPETGDTTEWEAGDIFDVYISASRVRRQISELHTPILGKLLKDGKAWILEPPTAAETQLAQRTLADVELPDKRAAKSDEADDTMPWEK